MFKKLSPRWTRTSLLACLPLFLAAGLAHAASTQLPNGANLEITILSPLPDQEFRVPVGTTDIDVAINGVASIGQGVPDLGLIVVVDVSGSTSSACDASRSVLQCEKDAVMNLLASANFSSVAEFGIVVFGEDGAAADMTPAGGIGLATTSIAETQTVVGSIGIGSVGQYTYLGVNSGATDYCAALAAATSIANAMTSSVKVAVFLSDGYSNDEEPPGFSPLLTGFQSLVDVIYPFAVGQGTDCTGGLYGDLADMGTCQKVTPEELTVVLPDLLSTTLESVELHLNGDPLPVSTTPTSPAAGPMSMDFTATATDLAPGDHEICATATGSDSRGTASVEECVSIHLLQLAGTPDVEVNDLNFDNEHTVTGEIWGGSGPQRDLDFLVEGQNADTASDPDQTLFVGTNAPVLFHYTVPQDCASLGTDTLTLSTVIAGEPDEVVLTKEWIDTVAPDVSCDPSVNPSGKMPEAPGTGMNEDGFYQLNGADPNLENCVVTLTAIDGDGYVFAGPFLPGDVIKYTQADGATQQQKKLGSGKGRAGSVTWHLLGHGDLMLVGTDPSGNQSFAMCMAAPKPK